MINVCSCSYAVCRRFHWIGLAACCLTFLFFDILSQYFILATYTVLLLLFLHLYPPPLQLTSFYLSGRVLLISTDQSTL